MLHVQVRLSPYKTSQGETTKGTVITGVAFKFQSESVQIELNRFGSVDVTLNGRLFEIDENEEIPMLTLDGFYLILSPDNYILQFINGILFNIQLTNENDALLVISTVPDKFKSKTKGLFGIMDGDISNDFSLPNGTILQLNASNDRDLFYKFGQQWQTNENNSIFTYADGYTHSNYVDNSYVPKFMSDGISFSNTVLEALANEQCNNNLKCLFDISTTGQLSIGAMNLEFEETINEIKESIDSNRLACVPLSSIFANGNVTVKIIPNGYEYEFRCNTGFCLKGQNLIKCEDSKYNFDSPVCLKCSNLASSVIYQSWLIILALFIALKILI